jgi:hypothetical protein
MVDPSLPPQRSNETLRKDNLAPDVNLLSSAANTALARLSALEAANGAARDPSSFAAQTGSTFTFGLPNATFFAYSTPAVAAAGRIFYMPFTVRAAIYVTEIGCEVTAAAAGSTIWMGIVKLNDNMQPIQRLFLIPTAFNGAATGMRTTGVAQTLTRGLYAVAFLAVAGTPSVRAFTYAPQGSVAVSNGTTWTMLSSLQSNGSAYTTIADPPPADAVAVGTASTSGIPAYGLLRWTASSQTVPPANVNTTPVFNAKTTYGAVGNGVADDTTALQNMLNAAAGTGGTAYIPAGTYLINSALTYGSNFALAGDGGDASTMKNTRTRTDIQYTPMLVPVQNGVVKQNVTVRDLGFNQEGDYYDGVLGTNAADAVLMSVLGTNGMTVQRCKFDQVRSVGIWSDTNIAYEEVSNLAITDNLVVKANGDGFSFFGVLTDSKILRNELHDCADDAIAIQNTAYGQPTRIDVSDNLIQDCSRRSHLGPGLDATPYGIDLFGAANVTVARNRIERVFASCIRIGSGAGGTPSTNVTATANYVAGAGTNNDPGTTGTPSYGFLFVGSNNVVGSGNTYGPGNLQGNLGAIGTNTNVSGFPPLYP